MRITFILPPVGLAGGIRAVASYAKRLHDRGHTVVAVSPPRKEPALRAKVKSLLSGNGWPTAQVRPPSHLDGLPIRHIVLDRYRPIIASDVPDADVIIATWWETAEWVAAMPPSKGAKAYFCQHHEVVFNNQPTDRVAATWRLPMQKIVCARWLLDVARDKYGDHTAIHVPYGVDKDVFFADPRGKQPQPTVGMMYSHATFKGCDVAIEAFNRAAKNVPKLKLIAFGARPPVAHLPLPSQATYFQSPPQEKIREIYSSCDAWLFASRCEGFGLPVLEAMACRTPVIATPTGAGPEVVGESNGGGILVPIDDPQAMADAIQQIVTLPDAKWRAMSETAHEAAMKFDWEVSTEWFEAALMRVAGVEASQTAAA
jgi:glycosyltransferase involved in cell wall biosynthesis